MIIPITHVGMSWYSESMRGKAVADKKFDSILRRMLLTKPLSRAEVSAKIQARRKGGTSGK
jgi:hypothetical protein